MAGRTVYDILAQTAQRYENRTALCQPAGRGQYRTYTWGEYRRAVEEIAAGLGAIGVGKGDVVGLDCGTRAEFYLADVAIMSAGAVAAAIYGSHPPAERVRTLRAADVRAVLAGNAAVAAELRGAPGPPLDVPFVVLTGEADGAMGPDELRRRGREALAGARFESPASPEDAAILYLTSGATGEPKMAVVNHRALVANIDMGPQVLKLTPEDRVLAFLPSAHVTQRVVMELLPLGSGVPVWFSEGLRHLAEEIRSVEPTIFVAPPRVWERIHTSIRTELHKRPAPVRAVVDAALALGRQRSRLREQGRDLPPHKRALLALVDRFVFSKMRARFGRRMRVAGSGSAPLGRDLAEFYMAIGFPVVEGYGLTEGGIVVLNPLQAPRAGSIGKPLPGVELRIADDGELLVRSATLFMGYYRDDAATAQVLRDGWLHTGDVAEFDRDGYVFITGRKKELVVSSTGRKIYPSRIEALFRLEPVVSHILPVGDNLPYVAALITVDTAFTERLKGMEGYRGSISQAQPVIEEVQQAVQRVNRKLAPFEQIKRWRILDRDFSIEQGELTATMKVRRERALHNFRDVVEELCHREWPHPRPEAPA